MSRSPEHGSPLPRGTGMSRRGVLLLGGLGLGGILAARDAGTARADQVVATPGVLDTTGATARVSAMRSVVEDVQGMATATGNSRSLEVQLHASVAFAKDSAVLLPAARARLAEVVDDLHQRTPGAVSVTGYTDDLGSVEHGLVLSRQRADAVAAVLRAALGPGWSITSTGRGEADPLVPNTSEANRARNRRVVVRHGVP